MLLTLAPGSPADNVLKLLYERKTLIGNFHADVAGYLNWALDTARVLRNQIRQSDIDRLVFTPRLWRLQELADGSRQLQFRNSLLSAELTEQAEAFDEAYTALQNEISRWTNDQATLAVLDTSVFLFHPDKIRDIDFHAILHPGFSPIRLVVPRLVVDELDRLKESGNEQSRWRAGHTLGVFDELLQNPKGRALVRDRDADYSMQVSDDGEIPRDRVTLEVLYDDPQHVRLDDPDAEIIDRTRALEGYAGGEVSLITMDTSMALCARMEGLRRVHKVRKDIGPEPPKRGPKTARSEPVAAKPV